MSKQIRNMAASVLDRLKKLARAQGDEFQFVLTRYAIERLLYRLSQSPYRDEFVLKGAMLFRLWSDVVHRPTRDLDLLGRGDASVEYMKQVFRELALQDVEDEGLTFEAASVKGEVIKEDQEYPGVRITLHARLGQPRIDLQVDIGFGDAITPEAQVVNFPTLLGQSPPSLKAYPRETVVAEKFQAMVILGMTNSRMKDFFDLHYLAKQTAFDGIMLCNALKSTFTRRKTAIPSTAPLALTDEFSTNADKIDNGRRS